MSNPKVTVLMTIYKDKSYLKEAVDSILNQTFQNFEFLIVNEFGYDDGSVDILKSYNDSRIRIIQNNVKKGFAASLNIGLAQARGEYIARMDGDDVSAPDRLEKQVKYLDLHKNTGIVSCWYKVFCDLNRINKGSSNDKRLKSNLIFFCDIAHGGSMFRKSLFDKYNLRYDESCPIEDHDLWSRASLCFDIHIIPQVLFYYRWDGNNISNNKYDLIILYLILRRPPYYPKSSNYHLDIFYHDKNQTPVFYYQKTNIFYYHLFDKYEYFALSNNQYY